MNTNRRKTFMHERLFGKKGEGGVLWVSVTSK